MKIKTVILLAFSILAGFNNTFSQETSGEVSPGKLVRKPNLLGFQIEATTLLLINEVGGLIDYDIFSSLNRKQNIGLRFGGEYYFIENIAFGGGGHDESYFDINFFARHSIRGKHFWFSTMLGPTIYNSFGEGNEETKILLKIGIELKYNIYTERLGLIFKVARTFNYDAGYLGIGLSYGIYDL